jgi:hypothetical protein
MKDSGNKSRLFQRRPRLFLVVLSMFGILLVLVVAEFAVRLVLPQWAPTRAERVVFWVYDPQLGWAHRPNQQGRFTHPDFSVSVKINSRGLRDREHDLRPSDKKRMMILGDSFGWGFGVEQEDRFSEVLERRQPDWEIINASVSGYSTDQEYLFVKDRGLAYRPDIVLLLVHDSDFAGNDSSVQYGYNKPYFCVSGDTLELRNSPVPTASFRQTIERFLMGNTYLWRRIYLAGAIASNRVKAGMDRNRSGDLSEQPEKRYEVMAQLIRAINGVCRQAQSRFLVVSCPLDEKKQFRIQTVCAAEGIPYLPLDDALAQSRQAITFPHDDHWNATGHRLAADALDAFLRRQEIFPPSSPASPLP